jgi:hypothetical protein
VDTSAFFRYESRLSPQAVKDNPNATKADIIAKVKAHRDEIRQRVVKFLSPDQLSKWDNEIAKGKEFLGQKLDA